VLYLRGFQRKKTFFAGFKRHVTMSVTRYLSP
jgi:hypothetical protein